MASMAKVLLSRGLRCLAMVFCLLNRSRSTGCHIAAGLGSGVKVVAFIIQKSRCYQRGQFDDDRCVGRPVAETISPPWTRCGCAPATTRKICICRWVRFISRPPYRRSDLLRAHLRETNRSAQIECPRQQVANRQGIQLAHLFRRCASAPRSPAGNQSFRTD
jgi:hypothetical protein